MENVKIGDEMDMVMEPDNPVDKFAVALYTKSGDKVGFVPAYYNEQVTHRLKLGMSYLCEITEVNLNNNCGECIRVDLRMPKED
jgi:hypothetical protein